MQYKVKHKDFLFLKKMAIFSPVWGGGGTLVSFTLKDAMQIAKDTEKN
jgi:hypothetical protein